MTNIYAKTAIDDVHPFKGKHIVIATDSRSVADDRVETDNRQKLHRNGNFFLASTGSGNQIGLLTEAFAKGSYSSVEEAANSLFEYGKYWCLWRIQYVLAGPSQKKEVALIHSGDLLRKTEPAWKYEKSIILGSGRSWLPPFCSRPNGSKSLEEAISIVTAQTLYAASNDWGVNTNLQLGIAFGGTRTYSSAALYPTQTEFIFGNPQTLFGVDKSSFVSFHESLKSDMQRLVELKYEAGQRRGKDITYLRERLRQGIHAFMINDTEAIRAYSKAHQSSPNNALKIHSTI